MVEIMPKDRFFIIQETQRQFFEELETIPFELHPSLIRAYDPEDMNSPGLLSLVALPYWIGEKLKTPQGVCKDMAVGNLFLLHCFQSFDFIVDKDRPETSDRTQVVLGNLCFLQVLRHYSPYFPAGTLFWRKMDRYWREWGESMSWEVETPGLRRPFEEDYLIRSAQKAAALKICPVGLAILAERIDLIPKFEHAIDLMHATLQLVDDLQDWPEDLQYQRYNSFLGLMITTDLIRENEELSRETLNSLIADSSILEQYLVIIENYSTQAKKAIDALGIRAWSALVGGLATQAAWLVLEYKNRLENVLMKGLNPEMTGS